MHSEHSRTHVTNRPPVFRIVKVAARLTEVVGGSELEVEDGSGVEEKEVVSCEDVCDEDVRAAADEVVDEKASELGSEEVEVVAGEEKKEEVEEEGATNEDEVVSSREEVDTVEVLTLSLEEVGADVLLAWLLDPPPAVPEGSFESAMYPNKP